MANTFCIYCLGNPYTDSALFKPFCNIGIGGDKGPTSKTSYWNGVTPPVGGYSIYLQKSPNGPSIYTCSNDSELISLTSRIAGTTYTNTYDCFNYYRTDYFKLIVNRDYEAIETQNLSLNLDAGYVVSSFRSGSTLYDTSFIDNNTTKLVNNPTYNLVGGGAISFDGISNFLSGTATCTSCSYIRGTTTIPSITSSTLACSAAASLSAGTSTSSLGGGFSTNTFAPKEGMRLSFNCDFGVTTYLDGYGVLYMNGKYYGAQKTSGIVTFLDCPTPDPVYSAYTVSVWVNNQSTTSGATVFSSDTTTIRINSNSGPWAFNSAVASSSAETNTWINLVGVQDETTQTLYINGVSAATATASSLLGPQFYIGKGQTNYWKGYNSIVSIYSSAITANQVLNNYNAISGRYNVFTSTWNTANTSAGSSTSTQVTLPLISTGTYNMTVDWGDNSTSTITTWNQVETTHTYSVSGTYEIKITGICKGWKFGNTGDRLKFLNVSKWGCLDITTDSAFYGCTNFSATTQDAPIISTTSLLDTFRDCSNFNGNLNNWDVSNVTNMQQMFLNAFAFNQPIGNWNTSKVTNMLQMFREARAFNQNIGTWDVSKVTSMNGANTGMFYSNTVSNFNNGGSPSINNWNMSGITTLYDMFNGCTSFNQPIGNWNVSNVTSMNRTFYNCAAFDQDLSSWNMSKVVEATEMFRNCTLFNNGGNPNINNWVMSACTSLQLTFGNAVKFNQPINSWNTSNVTNMLQTFYAARVFNQSLSSWNTSNVTNMLGMFREAFNFNQDISMWNVSKVTTFGSANNGMFYDANAFNQNLSDWDLRIAGTDLTEIFRTGSIVNGMSCQNYTDTLVAWANYVQTNGGPFNVSMTNQTNRKFDGARSGGAGFANASAARTYLTTATPTGAGWTISGDNLGTC